MTESQKATFTAAVVGLAGFYGAELNKMSLGDLLGYPAGA